MDQTIALGIKFGQWLKSRKKTVSLVGDLGSGKTTFTKGVALGMGISETVKSPTFVMLKEYKYDAGVMVHVDAYRLSDDFEDIGLDDYFGKANVLIEWAGNIEKLLPTDVITIDFKHISSNEREICFDKELQDVLI